ncbi:MAG: hypothetical protein IJ728_00235 [Selenomonadaceae bacterium]|nr:hypothetical protein [Selenomonadaceae bacterium]
MGLGGLIKNAGKSYLNSRISGLLGENGGEDISISLAAEGSTINLPVIPESYKCTVNNNNEVVNINMFGDYLMKGKTGLKTITLSSFLPAQEYNFSKGGGAPWGIVDSIEKWRTSNEAIELTISGSSVHFTCLIESFEYGEQDGSGDVYYSLALKEYRELETDPAKQDDTTGLNERKKLSYLQKMGLNAARNILNGQSPLNAITNAVGQAGLTNKQAGYLAIGKMIMRGGVSAGDAISFGRDGAIMVNGTSIGKFQASSFNPRSWSINRKSSSNNRAYDRVLN